MSSITRYGVVEVRVDDTSTFNGLDEILANPEWVDREVITVERQHLDNGFGHRHPSRTLNILYRIKKVA